MSDYFDRLEAELCALTRDGAHLEARRRHLAGRRTRRATAALLLALLLAVTLVSEFPSAASGHPGALTAPSPPTALIAAPL